MRVLKKVGCYLLPRHLQRRYSRKMQRVSIDKTDFDSETTLSLGFGFSTQVKMYFLRMCVGWLSRTARGYPRFNCSTHPGVVLAMSFLRSLVLGDHDLTFFKESQRPKSFVA